MKQSPSIGLIRTNNVVGAKSEDSDQPAYLRSPICLRCSQSTGQTDIRRRLMGCFIAGISHVRNFAVLLMSG